MRTPRSGSARRTPRRRRGLATAAALTGAALAVGSGVALDRVVLPAFDGDRTAPAAASSPVTADNAETPPATSPNGTTRRPVERTTGNALTPPPEPETPLKRLRQRPTKRPSSSPGSGGSGGTQGGGSTGGSTGGGSTAGSGLTSLEARVVELTNQERAKAGCGALRVDRRLVNAARGHSADMAAKGYFSHNSPSGETPWDRMKKAGYPASGGENIAMGYPTAEAVMKGWMNSSGHRANILNCGYKAIGVGVKTGSGGPWWTQNFGTQ
ncbi:CAP domain-containing protein [Thermomonospora cellulosilytica]|uniref:Uncharacterized protein YkwD n=1 Tax=Thermomonospora cellulosilytica TaxID=1411118 RepID=A0A7W3MSU7_9ACTN|nr:CAP domain-containing protein [Thermomonospora cellulosilytica]MBA9001267.1 uncharacterized protein YkwD [Thermomonospora cellulosilytica]